MNLSSEVSSMQSELESLRSENAILKRDRELYEFENDRLKRALVQANAERDHHMVKKGELKMLLDSAGALLVNGVRKYHEPETIEPPKASIAGTPVTGAQLEAHYKTMDEGYG